MMRSLTVKLTMAFLLVGLIGAILVAVLVGVRTRSEFSRFLSEHDQSILVTALSDYYASQGSWEGVGEMLAGTPQLDHYSRDTVLVDAGGRVVLPNVGYTLGQEVPQSERDAGIAITSGEQPAGVLLLVSPDNQGSSLPPPDRDFLDRVTWAAGISAGIAAVIALGVGLLLAQRLTRPLRELTLATQAMAGGQLDQRVEVRSRDEIGDLAGAFNQMSADLARASTLRKQMTADLAHDLRTPLSILRGYTEGLQDARLQGSPKLFTIMHGEVEHLQWLVEDLRVLSLADAGELPLNRRAVDPAALLERAGLAYIDQAEQQGVELRIEPAEGLPSVLVDTDRIAQVLNNLLSNALRFTPAGGMVALSAGIDHRPPTTDHRAQTVVGRPSSVVLQVRDTGSGIAPEDLPFVFERFYRADKARQRSDASGLGLAIARAIVEAHGGTIGVASTLGQGSTFSVRLPMA